MASNTMTTPDAMDRVRILRRDIEKHQEAYYTHGISTISDREFDELFEELDLLESMFPELRSTDSPTQKVGFLPKIDRHKVVEYPSRMYSLDNVYTEEGLISFFHKIGEGAELYVDLKHDGIAVELVYEKGKLKQGILRGSHAEGLDITSRVALIREIPQTVRTIDGVIKGEITLTSETLEKLNRFRVSKGLQSYRSQRHGVSGAILNGETPRELLRELSFTPYSVSVPELMVKRHSDAMEVLKLWGFKRRSAVIVEWDDIVDLRTFYTYYQDEYMKGTHPIDGIVVRINDLARCEELGFTQRAPKFAVAYKFPEKKYTGTIASISYGVGRTGVIVPTAQFTEVLTLDNIEVRHASLHSVGNVKAKGYYPGCQVEVYRAGGVIPTVGQLISEPTNTAHMPPRHCPGCGGMLSIHGEHLYCQADVSCPGIAGMKLVYVTSRDCLNIKGLGNKFIMRAVYDHGVQTLQELFAFIHSDVARDLPGGHALGSIQEQIEYICTAIDKGDQKLFKKLCVGLCIDGLTPRTFDKLYTQQPYGDLVRLLCNQNKLQECGLTEKTAKAISISSLKRKAELLSIFKYIYSYESLDEDISL